MPYTLLSALLTLIGMACLAALLTQKKTDCSASVRSGSAAVCVLASFLLLPVGPFPAYIPLKTPMAAWFVLFGLGCMGALPPRGRSRAWVLSAPLFLGLVYAVCAQRAAGFPGDLWHMETFVTLPLSTGFRSGGTSLTQLAGIGLLGLATLLFGAWFTRLLRARRDMPYLSACLRLAVAAFTVCLFGSALVHLPWPTRWAFLAEYALYWALLGVVLTTQPPLAPYGKTTAWPLLGAGALLCLL